MNKQNISTGIAKFEELFKIEVGPFIELMNLHDEAFFYYGAPDGLYASFEKKLFSRMVYIIDLETVPLYTYYNPPRMQSFRNKEAWEVDPKLKISEHLKANKEFGYVVTHRCERYKTKQRPNNQTFIEIAHIFLPPMYHKESDVAAKLKECGIDFVEGDNIYRRIKK